MAIFEIEGVGGDIMLAERQERRPATWLWYVRRTLVGLGTGSIPAIIMLAVLVGAVPQAVNLQAVAVAYFLYFVSLPIAALLFRNGVKSPAIGFSLGVLITTCVVVCVWALA